MADAVAAPPITAATAVLPNLDRIIRGLLYIYIFSLPFKHLLFIERNGFIILIVLLVLWCAVNRRHFFLRTPIDLPLLAFIAWVGFTVPFATFPAYSSKEFAKLLQQGLIFYVVVYFFHDPVHRRRLVWMLIGQLALVSVYGSWQFDTRIWMGYGVPGGRELYLIESFLPGEVWLTSYLVMLIPLSFVMAVYALRPRQRLVAVSTTGIAVLCQFLTMSRAGILSLLVEAFAFGLLSKRKGAVVMAGIMAVGIMAGGAGLVLYDRKIDGGIPFIPGQAKLTSYNLEARLQIWGFAISKVSEHPFVGIGYGKDNFYIVLGPQSDRLAQSTEKPIPAGTHNTFIEMAVAVGIPGLFLFSWLLLAVARDAARKWRIADDPTAKSLGLVAVIMIAGLTTRIFFDHMFIGTMAILFWVLVGLSIRVSAPSSGQSPSSV